MNSFNEKERKIFPVEKEKLKKKLVHGSIAVLG